MQPLVNMLPIVDNASKFEKKQKSIRSIMDKSIKSDRDSLQDELDRLELKMELLLQNMQFDLNQLVMTHKSVEELPFQKDLVMIIGANTREASQLVIRAYKNHRQACLDRLLKTSCQLGPKMDQTISGQSRSRKD